MPGVLDFLFEGRPPTSVTTYGQTVENIPKWLSDYTQGLIGRANVIAAEPYQGYEGPRIAGFSPDQLASFDMLRSNIGSWSPGMGYAAEATATGGSANPLNVAAPFIGQAAQMFPGAVEQYMDPYIGNVLDRQAELSQRQLTEQFLPELQNAFVGSGSFGGDRMIEMGLQGTRDIAEGLQGQQLGALSQAYGQAGQLFGQDMSRMLQAGTAAGALAGQTGELQLAAGSQMAGLMEALQAMQFRDTAGLEAIGSQQQQMGQSSLDLAYGDFLRQQNYPREMVDWMSQIVRGLPAPVATTSSQTGPADVYGPSGLAQLAALYSTYKGLQNSGGGARGGLVRAYSKGGKIVDLVETLKRRLQDEWGRSPSELRGKTPRELMDRLRELEGK